MAGTKISALTAAAALGGTEAIPGVQSAANVKITAAQIKTFTSASPTLVTPVLGVATATSLAVAGANIDNTAGYLFISRITGGNGIAFGELAGNPSVNGYALIKGDRVGLSAGNLLGWTATAGNVTAALDTGLSRISAGVIGVGTGAAASVAGSLQLTNLIGSGYLKSGSYTVATKPSASAAGAGARIYISDEAGGATPAFSDATDWRRYADRAIVS